MMQMTCEDFALCPRCPVSLLCETHVMLSRYRCERCHGVVFYFRVGGYMMGEREVRARINCNDVVNCNASVEAMPINMCRECEAFHRRKDPP
jgi:hypothetical protein